MPGLYMGNGGPVTQVNYGNPNVLPTSTVDISDTGEFAFNGVLIGGGPGTGGRAIYKVSGGALTNLSVGTGTNFSEPPSINDNGTVAFFAAGPGLGAFTLYTADGVTRTPIADVSGPFKAFHSLMINDGGAIAFQATLDNDSNGVYVAQGGTITTIADATTPGFDSAFFPTINDAGVVAFRGAPTGGGPVGIYVSQGGVITPYNVGSLSLSAGPLINAGGSVALVSGSGGNGIYTTTGAGATEVISNGDPLFGSTLSRSSFD
jgi:hypothetical protein